MATYLVTGAAGFIAAKVSEQLLKAGHQVIGIDDMNDAYDVRLKEWRLRGLQELPGFQFHHGDIAERAPIDAVLARSGKVAAIINLAARAGVRQSVENPWVYIRTNATGTLNLLDAAVKHDIRKFVLASTSSLYGGENPRPYVESSSTDRPLSPYAASKKAAEAIAYTYHYLHGIDVTVLRYFTVYGPAGRPDMSLFRFVQWISEQKPVVVYGDGTQERDFTYVDDIARGTVAGLAPVGYEIINLGSDQPVVLNDAVRTVEELLAKKAHIESRPRHPADVQATWADISKAKRLLSWQPETDFKEGVRRLVEWYNHNRAWASAINTG